ncbi:MAG: type II toxin-antitoxin system prevent-host-death family antitoxin [Gallionella sp.]|nr:type II toxin-antitoxin system prevent-host-death family antitoxin [Gallionella sp.]
MKNLNIREVRQELAHLDDLLNREGELVVTRHGKPIARVLPYAPVSRMPSLKEFRAKQPYQAIPSEVLIREDRDSRDF